MAIKNNKCLMGFLLLIISMLNTGCPPICVGPEYNFAVQSLFYPQTEEIKIGDTLYLESSFPTTLTDIRSGKDINYTNARAMGSTIGFNDINNLDIHDVTIDDFRVVSFLGKLYNSKDVPGANKGYQLSWEQEGTFFKLKIGIIPLKIGTYSLVIRDGLSLGHKNSKYCDGASFSITLSNTNKHLYLYEDQHGNLSDYDRQRSYCFRVVD